MLLLQAAPSMLRCCKVSFDRDVVNSTSKLRVGQPPPLTMHVAAKNLFPTEPQRWPSVTARLWIWSATDLYTAVRTYAAARAVNVTLEEDGLCVVFECSSSDNVADTNGG